MKLSALPVISSTPNELRGNLNITFDIANVPQRSEQWSMGDIDIQFVQLNAHGELTVEQLSGTRVLKVITGSLEKPSLRAFCERKALQDDRLSGSELKAGAEGALFALFCLPDAHSVQTMTSLAFSGPLSERLNWRLFSEQYGELTDAFNGADAYIGPGFHLLDEEGDEITYLNLWTAGKGVDLTTHNHGHPPSDRNPAFAETHLVLCNGTANGGMYECSEPGAADRWRLPVPAGFEHGPFFDIIEQAGKPQLRDNGAVQYPWHGWQAGDDDKTEQSYDVVAAFETSVKHTVV